MVRWQVSIAIDSTHFDSGHRKTNLYLSMKLSAKMLQFYSDGSCYVVGRDNTSMVLPRDGPCIQLHGPGRQDVLTSAIVAKLILGVSKQSFD